VPRRARPPARRRARPPARRRAHSSLGRPGAAQTRTPGPAAPGPGPGLRERPGPEERAPRQEPQQRGVEPVRRRRAHSGGPDRRAPARSAPEPGESEPELGLARPRPRGVERNCVELGEGIPPSPDGESALGKLSHSPRHAAYPGLPTTPGQDSAHVSRETVGLGARHRDFPLIGAGTGLDPAHKITICVARSHDLLLIHNRLCAQIPRVCQGCILSSRVTSRKGRVAPVPKPNTCANALTSGTERQITVYSPSRKPPGGSEFMSQGSRESAKPSGKTVVKVP